MIRYPRHTDDDRAALVERHLPYVRRIVERIAVFLPAGVEREDLTSAGVVGLLEALDRYDPGSGNTFLTYATFRIRGAVLSELRDRDVLTRLERRKIREMRRIERQLEAELGRELEDEELAGALGVDMAEIQDLRRLDAMCVLGFEDLGYTGPDECQKAVDVLVHQSPADPLTLLRLQEISEGLAAAIGDLSEKERLVMSLYYEQDLTMKEIGAVLHVTESRVCQIHGKAVRRVREKLIREGLASP